MRPSIPKAALLLASAASFFNPAAAADDNTLLKSTSLNSCQDNSGFQASLFNVVYTPHNDTVTLSIVAVSSVQGSVVFDASIRAYGYELFHRVINPCDVGLSGLCPMTAGKIPLTYDFHPGKEAAGMIPSIAYNFPDIDAKVRVFFNMTDGEQAGKSVACVEAVISNGKTVDLVGVKWASAVVAGLALASSAVVSGLGHSNAASHVAANALSLFGYFQGQAMLGLTGINLPPAVKSWTQDFQWSMGIIRVGFMQSIFTWYQRSTGGTPSTLFDSLTTVSVQVQKRAVDTASSIVPRGVAERVSNFAKRGNIQTGSGSYIVYGIQRVAFKAGIESTNLFLTGLVFFCVFVVLTVMCVAAFKGYCELAVKKRWMKSDTFLEFRNGWFTVLKGILFRMTLIGFPQMAILCLWEFTQVDSAAEVVLAVFFLFGMIITLAWAAFKVVRIARRSVAMHRNPAYILFSDPQSLNKWGFLYVQFRASAYYFIVPVLGYTLVKAMFIAFAQSKGIVQAIGLILIEAAALIAASVLRPWMDKSTNSFNIAICAINFLNAIFLLMFTDVFDQPPLVNGVIGVVLWIANAVFALVLIIMLIVTTVIILFRKNPDTRYQTMGDDRASFMKSQTQLTNHTELDALAATARGDKGIYKNHVIDDDAESQSSNSIQKPTDPASMPLPPSTANSGARESYRDESRPSMEQAHGGGYNHGHLASHQPFANNRAPSPFGGSQTNLSMHRQQHNASPSLRNQNSSSSPWQRGAGYD